MCSPRVGREYGRGPAIMYSKINAHVMAFSRNDA